MSAKKNKHNSKASRLVAHRANKKPAGTGRASPFRGNRYHVVLEKDGPWWVASIPEIPGALSQGRTRDEAKENIRDAVLELFKARFDESKATAPDARPELIRI